MRILRTFSELLKQPEVILSLVSIVMALILGLTSIDPNNSDAQFQTGVLGVLGAIAATQIAVSYSSLKKDKTLSDFVHTQSFSRVEDVLGSHNKFYGEPLNPDFVRKFDYFFCTGISQTQFLMNNADNLVNILEDGGSLHVIIPNPNNLDLLEQIAQNAADIFTIQKIISDIKITLEKLSEINDRRQNKGKFEVGFIDTVPIMNLIIMEAGTQQGFMAIELYHYKSLKKDRLHFTLDKIRNTAYYHLFIETRDKIIRDANQQQIIATDFSK